jgi:uncharacterized protein (TIGR00255 family)
MGANMIHSMTAFARQHVVSELGQITLELKSVNHRFSEVSLRLPEEFRFLEPQIRERIGSAVKRGKIDCVYKYQAPEVPVGGLHLDKQLLTLLTDANREVEALLDQAAPSRAIDFLKWPGVIKAPDQDMEALGALVMELLDKSLHELIATRRREGEQLKNLLESRCANIEEQVRLVKERIPNALDVLRQRLMDRLAELKGELDQNRVEQEIVMLMNKSDVAEEVDRLATHVTEVRRVLDKGSPVGRRLDFLMQELNREANTLSAKSVDAELTRCAVELKVLIEQMREQIQNIE